MLRPRRPELQHARPHRRNRAGRMEADLLHLETERVHVSGQPGLDQRLGIDAVVAGPGEALLQEALRRIQGLQVAQNARVVE